MASNDTDLFEEKAEEEDIFKSSTTSEGLSDDFPAEKKSEGSLKKSTKAPNNEEKLNNDIAISLSDPEKVGEGMSSYLVYKVSTNTSMSAFRKSEMSVKRRFSDFLGLHYKLQAKHLPNGIIIAPAPDKSVIGMTKIKISKEEPGEVDFIERRRASLERYMNRLAQHKRLVMDPDFREFLEYEGDLPRALNTQTISGASILKLFHTAGDAIGKFAFKVEEIDQWFDDKVQEIEALEKQLIRLHLSFESLIANRKELALANQAFTKACATLASSEEHTGLAQALTQLSETTGKADKLATNQAEIEFYQLSENVKDYIGLLLAVKECLNERYKVFKSLQDAELALTKKREQKVKLELANKLDKISLVEAEIETCVARVNTEKEHFDRISETIKEELADFDLKRVRDFKTAAIACLESMVECEEKRIKHWEDYLPEAKAIASN